jgi:DNA-binding SARP family transcriptional activator
MLSVSLLGDFRIRHDQVPVTDVDTPRLQSLLAYLLLHREAPQSRAHLAFLFWPDTSEAQARTNLRNLLHHLRRALPEADRFLDASVQTVQWRSDAPFSLDVADFDAALARAEQAPAASHPAAVREALESAVALYHGDLLPSCYEDWILPHREGLRQAYLSALERLVRLGEEQCDYPAAIRNAQRLLQHDPLHEATYRHLIRLHALAGDRAGALRVYHTCTTVLQRELDLEPSAATRQAYEQLLGPGSRPSLAMPAATAFSPLVGREREWAQMLHAWRAVAAGGEPHMLVLCGEAGIGKTRLAEELLQWAARQGISSAHARCYAAEGELAYAPVAAWLRAQPLAPLEEVWLAEVARLLPEVLARRPDLPRPGALTETWQRERLFEALSRALLGFNQPLLLAIDDLQWCDRDSLEWLHFLLRFDRMGRLLAVGTYRPEEIGEGHPLLSLLQALRLGGQVTEVDLGPLDEAATRTLATLVAGTEIGVGTAQRLYRETEGNPLFVVESVRAGLAVQDLKWEAGAGQESPRDPLPGDVGLPPKVQAVLEARLAQVSPPARELAGLAATIGREFSFQLLARAGGREEDTLVRELDELWRRRIVREHGAEAYDFGHDKLREVCYRGMSAARRRLLHRHVARALEALHAAELDPVSPQLAAHYERAGLPEQAAPYYLRAAQVARRVYANEEAITLLRRGLALLGDDGPGGVGDRPGHELAARLYEELGDLFELAARHEEALQAFQSAQARIPHRDRIGQARLHRKVGAARREQRLYAEALDACQQAEMSLGRRPDEHAGSWWAEWLEVQVDRVWAHYWLAQWPEMEDLVERVRPVVQERGGAASRLRFLMASCLMHLRRERYAVSDGMLADSREALALSREWGSLRARIDCQFELGFLHLWRRELEEAEESLQAVLGLAEASGAAWMRTLSLTYLTVLYRFRGQIDGVSRYARRAQEAAEAAHMPDYVAAARGNQAWLAWRRRDLAAAEQKGLEALAIWRQSPLVYPFQWQALWPLLAVARARGREDQAWAYARALFAPTQQHLPDELNAALEAAVQAQEDGQAAAARSHLDRTLALARELGYL